MRWFLAFLTVGILSGCRNFPIGTLGTMNDPNQASQVMAAFRNGQTFVTWQEVAQPNVSYRIYRSRRPFETADQLNDKTLLATVNDYTSLNLMASVNRMKFSKIVPPEPYRLEARINYVIEAGQPPLTDSTGLFVYTAKENSASYYAVTVVVNGVENRSLYDVSNGNVTHKPAQERLQRVKAVPQNSTDYVHWTSDVDTRFYPAMGSKPSLAYNFRVHAPQGAGPYALIGVLHGGLFQFNTQDADRYAKIDGAEGDGAVRVAMDSPIFNTTTADGQKKKIEGLSVIEDWPTEVWYGYNSNFGTGRPQEQGKGTDYAVRRVLWTLDWASRHFPIDKERVSLRGESMGGIGALQMALLHSDKIAAVHAYVPMVSKNEIQDFAKGIQFFRINPPDHVQLNAQKAFPFLMITAGRADHVVGWPWKKNFAQILEQAQQGFILYWDGREHVYGADPVFKPVWGEPGGLPTMNLTRFSLEQSFPAIAYLKVNNDPGTVNFAVKPAQRPQPVSPGSGDMIGTINGAVDWDPSTIVDQKSRYEITLLLNGLTQLQESRAHVTPRRTQQFRPYKRQRLQYKVVDPTSGATLARGPIVVEEEGVVQVPNVPIRRTGSRLIISTGIIP